MPTIAEVRALAMQLPKKSRQRLGNELLDSVTDEPPLQAASASSSSSIRGATRAMA